MLTIIIEDYGLGEMYNCGFSKLRKFVDLIEAGITKHLPKLSKYF